MKTTNKKILSSFSSLSENFREWILENMCYHWFDDNTERRLLNKIHELTNNKGYFMFRYDDDYSSDEEVEWHKILLEMKYPFFAGSRSRIENIINNFDKKKTHLSNSKFKVYNIKEDKEISPKVVI